MTHTEHLTSGVAMGGAKAPARAAEITIRGRMVHGTEEKALAVLGCLDLRVFGSRSCSFGDTEMVLVVVGDGGLAREALEAAGLECQKIASVLVVPAPSGNAKPPLVACLTRAGVGILYCYALSPDSGGECLVFRTADDELALRAIEGGLEARAA